MVNTVSWWSQVASLLSDNLIITMGVLLVTAIGFKWIAYLKGKHELYFMSLFSKEMDKMLEVESKVQLKGSGDIERFVLRLLDQMNQRLPEGRLRSKQNSPQVKTHSIKDFASGKRNIIAGIKNEIDFFKSMTAPDFNEMTANVMQKEPSWKRLGFLPFDPISRLIDILPGLFIVFGIFGTFLGITAALPLIAQIDVSQIDKSAPILSEFVSRVAFAMHTSIFGIIFSVTLTLLNTFFPIKSLRADISKKLSNSLEQLWYKVHSAKVDPNQERLLKVLNHICDHTEVLVGVAEKTKKGNHQGGKRAA